MDLISKAIQDVRYSVPYEILRMAYMDDRAALYRAKPLSLDEAIRERTIVPRVVADTDIANGQVTIISLDGISPITIDDHNYIFEIPSERVDNRKIISVLSVNYYRSELVPGYQYAATPSITPMIGSELTSSAHRAIDTRSSIPIISTAEASVVGHNVIMIRNHLRTAAFTQIRCRVSNDANLQNLPLTVAPVFSKLCIFAVKAFIYNELIIRLDKGHIDRGHEISIIKSMVESYSDAEQNYLSVRDEEWGAVTIMADRPVYEDLIKMQIDPGI